MSSSIAAMIRGFTNGYEAGDRIKSRKEDRERQKREQELADQDRQILRDERQQKKDFARKMADNAATVGLPKEVDAGAGFKFTGPQAGIRAQEFIEDNNDPEFGIAAQGVNTQPLNERPEAKGIYTRKDEANDRIKMAGEMGDFDEVKAARAELANLYSEGVGQALQAFKRGGPAAAIKTYNEYGVDKFTDKFEEIDGGFRLYREDGSTFDAKPDEIERSQLDILKRAQLDSEIAKGKSLDALTKQRSMSKLGTGQVLVDPETNEIVATGPARPAPAARTGTGGRGNSTANESRYRLESLRKLSAQNDKIIGDLTAPPEAKKAALERNQKLNAEIDSLLFGEQGTPAPQSPNPETAPGKVSKFVFDKNTGRLVAKQ